MNDTQWSFSKDGPEQLTSNTSVIGVTERHPKKNTPITTYAIAKRHYFKFWNL